MSLSLPRFRQLLLWIASFAARAIGWYVIALVDVLDYLPQKYSGRSQLIGYLQRLALSIRGFIMNMSTAGGPIPASKILKRERALPVGC